MAARAGVDFFERKPNVRRSEMQLKVFMVPVKSVEAMEPEMNAFLRSRDTSPALAPTLGSGSGDRAFNAGGAKGIAEGRREEKRVFFLCVPPRSFARSFASFAFKRHAASACTDIRVRFDGPTVPHIRMLLERTSANDRP